MGQMTFPVCSPLLKVMFASFIFLTFRITIKRSYLLFSGTCAAGSFDCFQCDCDRMAAAQQTERSASRDAKQKIK